MATTLSTIRGNVRRDLHDEDANAYRWTNDEVDRAIARAVKEFSGFIPNQQKNTLTTTANVSTISVSTLTEMITIERVEYPVDEWPPEYCRFSIWAGIMTLLGDRVPAGVENVYVFWNKLHTLDANSSTIPAWAEDLIATGAAGYAAMEWASYATNRVNVGGERTYEFYRQFAIVRLEEFRKSCRELGEHSRVRSNLLYSPALPADSQSTDWGP